MRIVFFILFNAVVLNSYAQEYLNPSGYGAWGAIAKRVSSEVKESLLSQLVAQFGKNIMSTNGHPRDPSTFHVIDLDDNGLFDLVYSGEYGEGFGAVIYYNTGSQFQQSDLIAGEVVRIEKSKLSNSLEIKTHLRPCCAGEVHTISTYITYVNKGIKLVNTSNINYMEGTSEPSKHIKKIRFITINPEYKLRATPEIDPEFSEWMGTFDGNTCGVYPNGSRGIALAESTDETGRVWWFVEMENNIAPSKSLMYYGNEPRESKSMGWMSSRFVKQLE